MPIFNKNHPVKKNSTSKLQNMTMA